MIPITELFDGVAVITDRHVAESNIALGLSGGEALKIGSLSSGARGLLVAMVCYGVCDTFAVRGGAGIDEGHDELSSLDNLLTVRLCARLRCPRF